MSLNGKSRRSIGKILATGAAGIALHAGSGVAVAAPAPAEAGSLLEEITVTAQRREEAVQTVPLAVSAFTDVQLERLNITQTLDLVKLIPNMIGGNNTGLGTANVYSIRALNNTESIATFDPPVGSYVDDVFIARQNANNFSFFDIDRIEVLRGPQGTLFGRNTTGGAVNVILKKPAPEFGGYAEAGFGAYGMRKTRASVDLPLSATVLTKLSGYYVADDGYVGNPVTGEPGLNSKDNYGVRAALRWLPNENLTWDLAADVQQADQMNIVNMIADEIPTAGSVLQYRCGTSTRARYSCTGMRTDRANLQGLVVGDKAGYPLGNVVDGYSVTSNLKWTTGLGTVDFITGWRDLEQRFSLDFFNGIATNGRPTGPTGSFAIANDSRHKQFSQEIKFAGTVGEAFDFVAGVYYLDERNRTDFADVFTLAPAPGVTLPLVLEDRVLENTTRALAVYTQWDWRVTSQLTATLGARWTDEDKDIEYTPNSNPRIATPAQNRISTANIRARGVPTEQSISLVTPRVALKYEFTDDLMAFASATRGFRSGGWNARGTAPDTIQPFGPEKVWSYELGLRSDWFDGRLRANVTGFHYNADDFQLPSAFTTAAGAIQFLTRNFAAVRNSGVEVELVAAPVERLNVFASVGLQDAEYRDLAPGIVAQQTSCRTALAANTAAIIARDCGVGIVTRAGGIADPVRVADTYSAGASYEVPVGPKLVLTPSFNVQVTGGHAVFSSNTPLSMVGRSTRWDAGMNLGPTDRSWSAAVNCTNCANENVIRTVFGELPYYQDPRTWSMTVRINF
jgi:iron complex outermembrane receptor protein